MTVADGLLGFLLVTALAARAPVDSSPRQWTIGIVVFDGFLTSEVTAPIEVFGVAGRNGAGRSYDVVTIGLSSGPVESAEGLEITPQTTLSDAPALDVLVVPSATEMAPLTADPRLRDFIRDRARGASYVASHCAGAFLLGEAGLLEGRRVTTYPGGEADLAKRNPMATVTETEIVVDGDLVTSSGAVVSYEASLSLLRAMTADAELVAAVRSELYLDRLTASPRRGPSQNPAGAARVAGSKEER